MNKTEAISRIEKVDENKEDVYLGIFPKQLECDICHKHPRSILRDVELGVDVCGACAQLIDRLKALPQDIVIKLL